MYVDLILLGVGLKTGILRASTFSESLITSLEFICFSMSLKMCVKVSLKILMEIKKKD